MNEDVKTVMIRCDDNIEALLFRKYKYDGDYTFTIEDAYSGTNYRGISGRIKRAWKAFWNKPVIYNGIYCGGEGRDRVRNFLKECLELAEGE